MAHAVPPIALTIAGSDSGGGAGIQADIKAMQANGAFAASVITAITAQNTTSVASVFELPVSVIADQIDAVMSDMTVRTVKAGMLSSSDIISTVAERLRHWNVKSFVLDPVMVSKSGYNLLREDAVEALRNDLFPLATLVTPNALEAARLTGLAPIRSIADARRAARTIHEMGAKAVLVKGGHLEHESEAVDVLYDGVTFHLFREARVDTMHTHGTGCTYASAIAAGLARGLAMDVAVARAKLYVTKAIRHGLPLGSGHGPVDHFYFFRETATFPYG
jgi:hydroxymethylpyrimidine/phosphomethylpyrimidine kinase